MAEKTVKSRVQVKRGTSADWALATNFYPLEGEIIFYSDLNKIKVGNGNTLVKDLPFIGAGDIIKKVATIDDVPGDENGLYRYTSTVDGKKIPSNIVEVISEYHEGGESHEFRKVTTANNGELKDVASVTSQFENNLSTFVNFSSTSYVYSLHYAFNDEVKCTGLRLGSSKNQGVLTVNFSQDGFLLATKYYSINSSTGEVASQDANSQIIVDDTVYNLTNINEVVSIPLSAGEHTISSGAAGNSARSIILGFSFGGDEYYSYEKKHLARQEDLKVLSAAITKNKTDADTKHAELKQVSDKNTQDIASMSTKLGDVQIFDVVKSLPKASMDHLSELYRKDGSIYQCIKSGDGDHKEFEFNLTGDSEIIAEHLEQLYPTITKDFTDYLEFNLEDSSKVYRNNGSIKLGSSSATGNLVIDGVDDRSIKSLKIGLKAYNTKKSSVSIEVEFDGPTFSKEILVEDNINETLVDIASFLNSDDYEGNPLNYIYIGTNTSYYDDKKETTISTDPRACITRIIADFGNVTYEWIPVGGNELLVKTTYNELKALRDNAKLIPGQQYVITDYTATTCKFDTRSAMHNFGIIVTADNEYTLNENARAIKTSGSTWKQGFVKDEIKVLFNMIGDENYGSNEDTRIYDLTYINGLPAFYDEDPKTEGKGIAYIYNGIYVLDGETYDFWQETTVADTGDLYGRLTNRVVNPGYFDNANLESWEIKYCLDNDISRFTWAVNNGDHLYGISSGFSSFEEPLVRCPDFDYPDYENSEDHPNIEDYVYAWGTQADIDDNDKANFVYSKSLVVDANDLVFYANLEDYRTGAYTDGKGVIYYMKDEYNNEAPYDFKNIQFKRELSTDDDDVEALDFDEGISTWCYTFGGKVDRSIRQADLHTYNNNSIGNLYTGCDEAFGLPDNVFLGGSECMSKWNRLGNNCSGNTFGAYSQLNIFGNHCTDNMFGCNCLKNTFGNECTGNVLGNDSCDNTFEDNCQSNTIGTGCELITFGNSCSENSLSNTCYQINLGDYCVDNSFEKSSSYISLGNTCKNNTFKSSDYDHCGSITFGNYCSNNTLNISWDVIFGDSCTNNSLGIETNGVFFGNKCNYNTIATFSSRVCLGDIVNNINIPFYSSNICIGRDCSYIRFNDEEYNNIIVEDFVNYVTIKWSNDVDYTVRNITLASGISGESSKNPKIIEVSDSPDMQTIYRTNTKEIILD